MSEYENNVWTEHLHSRPVSSQHRTPNKLRHDCCQTENVAMRCGLPSCSGPKPEGSLGEWRGSSVHLGF